ncbi:hypothetical protein McPS_25240 [Marichromatium sp. PS1]|uniref:NUDIX hydrolase n=1 Tax=Marichromatium sp. PS1 TaxID=3138932 RepID=UPI0032E79F64
MSRPDDIHAAASALDRAIRALYRVGYRLMLGLDFVRRPRTHGAYVAVWHDERLLLIRNSYKGIHTLPAGGIKRGERAVEAARRELCEEVGIAVPIDALRESFQTLSLTEYKRDHIRVFDLRLDSPSPLRLDGREVIWAGFRTPEEALRLPLHAPVAAYLRATLSQDRED